MPDLLERVSERYIVSLHLRHESGRREDGPVLRSANDHVGVVPSLRLCQPEAGGVDRVLYIQNHQARSAPRQEEVRPDISRRDYRAARGTRPACANSYLNRGVEAVVILL